jgi:hypothetical protein
LRFLLFTALRLCVTTEWFVRRAKLFNLSCAQPTLMSTFNLTPQNYLPESVGEPKLRNAIADRLNSPVASATI